MAAKIQAVRGMNDILPDSVAAWHRVEATLRAVGWAYGYQEIRTPILEKAELFAHSIGGQTDIVEKEMYAFADRGGDTLALRPEATASTVRAGAQHGLFYNQQQRFWYMGPMFRRERPQKGRYRQFHQFGVEAFGWSAADMDAEVIRLSQRIWTRLGIRGVRLQLNTLGSPRIKTAYRAALYDYLAAHRAGLDADSQRRLTHNPLRILDSKDARTQEIVAAAPSILDFLDPPAQQHFADLGEALRDAGIEFEINTKLVRGLDYYTSTVFEWVTSQLGAQNAVCAGGRYDDLTAARGGAPTPAVGFALGLERLVELLQTSETNVASARGDIYIAYATPAARHCVARVGEQLRDADYTVVNYYGDGKLKNQMKRADASGARVAVIVGLGDDVQRAQVKWLRETRDPQEISVAALTDWCKQNL